MKVGYVGLGAMGGALARHLASDHTLMVWDLNARAVDALVDLGAVAARSLTDMARDCEIVFLCLPRTSDVGKAIFGPDGLAQGLSAGKIVIDQTSGVPAETAGFAAELAKSGVFMIDAPVAGGVSAALAGTITVMASGPGAALERALPVLKTISQKVFRCSDRVGDGQAMKAVNNAANAGYRMSTLEFVALGRKLGLPLDKMVTAINQSWARNFTSRQLLPAIVEKRASAQFFLTLMVKDLSQALSLGGSVGAPMPLTGLARGMMDSAANMLGDAAQLDDLVPFTEKTYGVSMHGDAGAAAEPVVATAALAAETLGVLGTGDARLAFARRLASVNNLRLVEAAPTDDPRDLVGTCDVLVIGDGPRLADIEAAFKDAAEIRVKTVIDLSRRNPRDFEASAAILGALAVQLIDAALSTEPGVAPSSETILFCGGPAAAVEALRPAVEASGMPVLHLGASGSGRLMGLIVNALAACNRQVICETAAVGFKFGLNASEMAMVKNAGSAWSGEADRILAGFAKGEPTTEVTLGVIVDELSLLEKLGFHCRAPMLVVCEIYAHYVACANQFGSDKTLDAMALHYERMTAVRFPKS